MAEPIDLDKIEKLPTECRFFDVNTLWYFPNRWAVRLLYPLPISANTITWIALAMGLVSATFYISGLETALVWGAEEQPQGWDRTETQQPGSLGRRR